MSTGHESTRIVAHAAAAAFGGEPKVERFYDEAEEYSVDLLTCADRPSIGFATYSTVGLHEAPNLLDGTDVRIEIAGVAPEVTTQFANMLATAAFLVMKDSWLCAPGVVFPSLVSDYQLSPTLAHVLWVPPFPWGELGSVEISAHAAVHWLLAVPISEAERQLLEERGFNVLEALLSEHEIDYFNLERASIV